jgi:uncharacterized protein (TIGR02646 family)
MRAIAKGREPKQLEEYRCKPDATYDGPLFTWKGNPDEDSVKDAIRRELLKEQGHLCAYCMKRIDDRGMKVEHWHCQDNYSDEQLDYQNMLGVCQGHEREPYNQQTCDTRKGNKDLKYNPANPNHRIESHIKFLGTGRIQAHDDGEFDEQLNKVLNLNKPRLVQNRQAIWNAVHDKLSTKSGSRTPAELQRLLDHWNRPDEEGRLQEYCAVAAYYLRRRLEKLAKSAV